jgi:inner membrane protein
LTDYRNLVAIRGEVIVQFWLRPGDKPVDLNLMAGGAR